MNDQPAPFDPSTFAPNAPVLAYLPEPVMVTIPLDVATEVLGMIPARWRRLRKPLVDAIHEAEAGR